MVSVRTSRLLFFIAAVLLQSSCSRSASIKSQLKSAFRQGNLDLCKQLIRGGALDDFPGPIKRDKIYTKLSVIETLLSNGIAVIDTRENDLKKAPSKEGEFDVSLIPGSSLVTRMAVNVTAVKNWGNKTIKGGRKPIHIITLLPDVSPSIVKIILENGNDDVNTKADSEVTPLILAAHSGNLEVVKFLLESGARINDAGVFLFSDASSEGRFAFSKLFSKTDLNSFDPTFYYTALSSAILISDVDMINYLLSKGASVNNTGQGWFALVHPVYNGRKDIVEIMIRSGIDVNSKDMLGSTALHTAAQTGNVEMARILVKHGARMDVTDYLRWMPIHVASFYSQKEMIRFLVESGSSIDSLTDGGYSPLNLIEAGFNQSFLSILLKDIYSLNQTEPYTSLPAENTGKNHTDIVDSLIQLGASLNHQDAILGWSTLHWAAAHGDLETAKLLVEYGAVVSARSKAGLTPYETAKRFGRKDVAEFLKTAKDLV